jgi:hypothetical protein
MATDGESSRFTVCRLTISRCVAWSPNKQSTVRRQGAESAAVDEWTLWRTLAIGNMLDNKRTGGAYRLAAPRSIHRCGKPSIWRQRFGVPRYRLKAAHAAARAKAFGEFSMLQLDPQLLCIKRRELSLDSSLAPVSNGTELRPSRTDHTPAP